jgi:hypothetical protein
MLTTKCACSECCALLPGGSVHTGQGARRCDFCGNPSSAGPLTATECQAIIDDSRGKRVVAGGDGVLKQDRHVRENRVGKYVHVLDVANVGGPDDGEPWFTCRVQGETPGPSEIYPAYPRSAIDPYVPTRENIQASSPLPLLMLAVLSEDQSEEREFHTMYAEHRIHGEWFLPHPEVVAAIRDARRIW